ncbi:hypothetical protein SDRG_01782 [Saprolegnia diclina VS20]|uniref:Complex 1 LYR protein domain-containing protein n=1 Tax=Saprolegnia diclina (strain VS20) TaxID=1156394 RepID=T0R2Z4_SAPDV|nr:hypothetical protein SDRG_01782 [Saprolegnia diclina VS20]EQC40710.1 hypothetical protein SDRG_01782 [Saprolegnia diclina VS20]|eukprot:XP_008605554.1 hypothetical protein SDRG_01782 [Saprolegnia diclina VS20]
MDATIRAAYKKLLKLAKSVPQEQRAQTLEKVRHEFRAHEGAATPEELDQLLRKAQSKISYLKIVTPKKSSSSTQGSHFVYKNGQRIDGRELSADSATIKTHDYNAMMTKHVQLVRRQHFMDRK